MKRILGVILILGALTMWTAAQGTTDGSSCPAIVAQALETTSTNCTNLGSNQVCYGNNNITATDTDFQALSDFATSGDTTALENISSLITAPFDETEGVWGVAVMSLRANLPDTLPGQNVTFVIYGDTALDTEENPDFAAPMQAFSLTTGVGTPTCREAPRDGLLVQSPQGATVNFLINGVEVNIGSTALIDLRQDEMLWVSNLEGSVSVSSQGETMEVPLGFKVLVTEEVEPHGLEPYKYSEVGTAPVSLLPEPITIPITVYGSEGASDWVESGVEVEAGQVFTVTAEGEVNLWSTCAEDLGEAAECERFLTGAAGNPDLVVEGEQPETLPDEPYGALIGRVGEDGEPFLVGEGDTFTAEDDGMLQFRINDSGDPSDNVGGFVLSIEVEEQE